MKNQNPKNFLEFSGLNSEIYDKFTLIIFQFSNANVIVAGPYCERDFANVAHVQQESFRSSNFPYRSAFLLVTRSFLVLNGPKSSGTFKPKELMLWSEFTVSARLRFNYKLSFKLNRNTYFSGFQ